MAAVTRTDTDLWPAPYAARPIDAAVSVPGSKSMTNRALILAALADGPSRIEAPLHARDTALMAQALRGIGTEITDDIDGAWVVTPHDLFGPAEIDCGLAGTVLRFVPPVATLARGAIRFDGDPRIRERPNGPLIAALRHLGADIEDGGRGRAPFVVRGTGTLPGGSVTVDATGSSQLISGLLLAAARFEDGVEVIAAGAVPSAPYLEMNIAMLRERGVDVETGHGRWTVAPGPVRALDVQIEADLNTAAPFAAAALATGGRVTISGWPQSTTQPGGQLPSWLTAMGATCAVSLEGLTVTGGSTINGIEADLAEVSELVPVLAALAVLADSPSRFTGVAHIRGHETDRITALATELAACGADVSELPDGLVIGPRPLHSRSFDTYDDHRLVMAAAVLGLAVDGIAVIGASTVAKTMPDFTDRWQWMLDGVPSGPTA
ncbi:MAG: 3-phosphoshikimate 1-carboxyvinyltransferase [Geodermatophilaceae bacterium]|jgi:3-phosphoshikimate 1-carboxyvinyltransferase|nr:3-phosphoshikimate 1-carboxyvinyltransferase [Geodermatophilaceae bacterium]